MKQIFTPSPRYRQSGAVLILALILLLILTLISVTAARMQMTEERMAQNDDNHQLAIQAAEAALRSAEGQVVSGLYTPAAFTNNANGLYTLQNELSSGKGIIPDIINWNSPGKQTTPYAGPPLSNAPSSPQPAQVIIERLPPGRILGGNSLNAPPAVYRITAHAVGGDSTSSATLQSIVVLQ